MADEFGKAKRRRWMLILLSLSVGIATFVCAIHWDESPFLVLCVLGFSAAILLAVPAYKCAQCGREAILIGPGAGCCSKCGTPYVPRGNGLFCLFSGRRRLALDIPLALMLLFFFMRLMCLPVLLLHIALGIFGPKQTRDRWMTRTAIAFLLLLLPPIDVEIAGFHGSHFGVPRTGPRFVRLVMGMPMTRLCIAKYGEFISGGCVVSGNEPAWLFVWESAGLKPATIWRPRVAGIEPKTAEGKPLIDTNLR